jgi:hypothetical protein
MQGGELLRPGLDRQPELTAQIKGSVGSEPEAGDRQSDEGGQALSGSLERRAVVGFDEVHGTNGLRLTWWRGPLRGLSAGNGFGAAFRPLAMPKTIAAKGIANKPARAELLQKPLSNCGLTCCEMRQGPGIRDTAGRDGHRGR